MQPYGQAKTLLIEFLVKVPLTLSETGISSLSSKPQGGAIDPVLAIILAKTDMCLQQELAVKRLRIHEPKRLLFEAWVWGNLS